MSAINVIEAMDMKELIKYYKYCLNTRFASTGYNQDTYPYVHPSEGLHMVFIEKGKTKQLLDYPNEIFLINQMLKLWDQAESFAQAAFCSAMMARFTTRISYRYYNGHDSEEESIKPQSQSAKQPAKTYTYNGEVYSYLGSGYKREAYLSPCATYVIKVPINELGFEENRVEAETYKANPNSIYAQCELLPDGLLKMEYVKPAFLRKGDDYPDWILAIAETQVGHNLQGKLVAYDYGSEI